jgi:uncharacterized membrane protein YjdF
VWLLTTAQLLAAVLGPDLPQFEGKAFGWRLATFAPGMLVVPAAWWLGNRGQDREPPYVAFALVMSPFLFDVTGNTLDLYDTVDVFDDVAHVVTWFLLCAGLGLIVARDLDRRWVVLTVVTGIGALLAIGYELAEWHTFIRHGTNDDPPYEDTLGDLALGVLGALGAAVLVARSSNRDRPAPSAAD